ncbi:hypothetical protein FGB62_10g02 [Gracilaria domingensis]|nr:hypothetical protein FGB62_10g02 [Gracilaria domingensis]
MSFYSNPGFSPETEQRPCFAVDRYDVVDGQVPDVDADIVILTCLQIKGNQFIQHVGNRSTLSEDPAAPEPQLRCAESPLYRHVGNGTQIATASANQTLRCDPGFGCVYTEIRGRELRVSEAFPEQVIDRVIPEQIPIKYQITFLFFDIDRSQEGELGERMLQAYGASVTDPLEQRRRMLTGSQRSTCPFLVSTEAIATEVPLALICILVTTWGLSVVALLSTLLFKRHIFYDMGDPLHWAQRTFRHIDEPFSENPVVTSVYEHGERLMYVSSSSSDEYDFLKRAVSGVFGRFQRGRVPKVDGSVEEQSGGTICIERCKVYSLVEHQSDCFNPTRTRTSTQH